MATQISEKPIHSIIIDTGPLINNTVSISTIINSAEVLYTTPAIIAEIRDPATRSRVETTLLPFLNVKTASPASFEAVVEFSKKTGDYSVLSKQDLGILALAYEVHCEKNGGAFGLRTVPKGAITLRPEEQAKVDEQNAKKETKEAKKNAKEAAIQRRHQERKQKRKEEKAAARAKGETVTKADSAEATANPSEGGVQLPAETSAVEATESEPKEVTQDVEQPQQEPADDSSKEPSTGLQEQIGSSKQKDGQRKRKVNSKKARRARAYAEKQALAETATTEDQPQNTPEDIIAKAEEQTGGVDISDASPVTQEAEQVQEVEQVQESEEVQELEQAQVAEIPQSEQTEQPEQVEQPQESEPSQPPEDTSDFQEVPRKKLHPAKARLARRAAELAALSASDPSPFPSQQPTPPATSDEESDGGEWITPGNLQKHQTQDTSDAPLVAGDAQLGVATMTTDYAMQNVLLQMNLHLLSPAMQRIRHARSTVLRCHACFLTTREMDKQFCPRCGQPTLQRVSCSTDADGTFQIHLSTRYQHNKRGDKYSIPKPVAGTSNGKMRGPGGGKGGWGRELVLSEDQKEYQKQIGEFKKGKARDPMDEDFLPGILTGDRSKAEAKPKVGAGRNVNSRKRM